MSIVLKKTRVNGPLLWAQPVAGYTADSMNMLSVGPPSISIKTRSWNVWSEGGMIPCITRRWYVNPNLNLNPKLWVKMEIERPHTKHIHRINCVACYGMGPKWPSAQHGNGPILKLRRKLSVPPVSPVHSSCSWSRKRKPSLMPPIPMVKEKNISIYVHMYHLFLTLN